MDEKLFVKHLQISVSTVFQTKIAEFAGQQAVTRDTTDTAGKVESKFSGDVYIFLCNNYKNVNMHKSEPQKIKWTTENGKK